MRKSLPIAIACLSLLGACSRVTSGNVGVEVNQYGSDRGVQANVVGPGTYFTGWNTTIYEYPTYTSNYVYSHSSNEGKAVDESIDFQAKGGVPINADFGITLHIQKEDASKVFQKYHQGLDYITDGPLRNLVRDSLNEVAGEMTFEQISNDIPAFMTKVNVALKKRASENGITVELLSNVGKFRPPEAIQAAINAQLQAKMDAITSQNQLQRTTAEAQKRVIESAADLQVATNDAQATAIRGAALAKNPEILDQMWVEKWDGHVAQYNMGGSNALIQMPKFNSPAK